MQQIMILVSSLLIPTIRGDISIISYHHTSLQKMLECNFILFVFKMPVLKRKQSWLSWQILISFVNSFQFVLVVINFKCSIVFYKLISSNKLYLYFSSQLPTLRMRLKVFVNTHHGWKELTKSGSKTNPKMLKNLLFTCWYFKAF